MLNPGLHTYIETLAEIPIREDRKILLNQLGREVKGQYQKQKMVSLVFVCTHNSRRSQFSQVLAKAITLYFELPNIHCYSAGTEATALFPMVAETLESSGFKIERGDGHTNPDYTIHFGEENGEMILFSKTIEEIPLQKNGFMAIMVCSDAEENCPFIPEATHRFALPFNDPKHFDESPIAAKKYKETCDQIGAELYYLFSKINAKALHA